MSPDRDVFERNLAALMTRSYEPVRPDADWRARTGRRVTSRACTNRHGRRERPAWRLTVRTPWLAAAVVLVTLGGVLWWTAFGTRDAARIVADGEVARRADRDAAWSAHRPVDGALALAPLQAGRDPWCEWQSPPGVTVSLAAPDRGTLRSLGAAAVWAEAGPAAGDVRGGLLRGRLDVACGPGSAPWRIATPAGEVFVEQGRVTVELVPGDAARPLRVDVHSGSAWVLLPDGRVLVPGVPPATTAALPAAGPPEPLLPAVAASRSAPDAVAGRPAESVTGRVRDAVDGRVVDRFELILLRQLEPPNTSDPVTTLVSDAEGRFGLGPLEPGAYLLFVRAEGYASWRQSLHLAGPESRVDLDVPLGKGAAVAGTVRDGRTGVPVAGARVLSESDAPVNALSLHLDRGEPQGLGVVTDHDGRFLLDNLPVGRHVLRASRPGFAPTWSEAVTVASGERRSDIVIDLLPGAQLHGTVRGPDGIPKEGANIVASSIDVPGEARLLTFGFASSDERGRYVIEDLPPGGYVVLDVVEVEGAVDAPPQGTVGNAVATNGSEGWPGDVVGGRERAGRGLQAGGELPGLAGPGWTSQAVQFVQVARGDDRELDIPRRATGVRLWGLLSAADGTARTDRMVVIVHLDAVDPSREDAWQMTGTDAGGRYVFDGLAPGRYRFFQSDGGSMQTVFCGDVEVPDVPELRHDLRLGGSGLAIEVVDAVSGAPLPLGVVVLSFRPERFGRFVFAGKLFTDDQGRCRVPGLPAGEYLVQVYPTREGHGQWRSAPIWLDGRDALVPVQASLPRGGNVSVLVTGSDGVPVADAQVTFLDADEQVVRFKERERTDDAGRYRVSGVASGLWRVRARAPDGREGERSVEVRGEGDHDVWIELGGV